MDLDLKGRTVLVTGASQGIGQAAASAFAAEGCGLRLVALDENGLRTVASDLRSRHGVSVETLSTDIAASGAAEAITAWAGSVDVLVNNAGGIPGGTLWDVDEVTWRKSWDLKVFGYINLARAFYPGMRARGRGVIVNNIGNAGENYDYNYIAGTTANAALMAFTRALGGRSPEHGIRVVGVNPGPVGTQRIVRLLKQRAEVGLGDANRYAELMQNLPMNRAATPEEIADLFVFLASDRSAYTSGTIVTVDGGLASRRSVA